MEKVRIDDLERYKGAATELRPMGPDLDAENLAMFYYVLEPRDSFLWGGIFRYEKREEVCYVLQGTVTFETEDGTVEAGPDEALRFAPGEWKGGTNTGTERVIALLVGAPQDRASLEFKLECAECE